MGFPDLILFVYLSVVQIMYFSSVHVLLPVLGVLHVRLNSLSLCRFSSVHVRATLGG